jgi:hypothetical protein
MKIEWLIVGLLITNRDAIQTETGTANLTANEQKFHMGKMMEIWFEV